MPTVIVEEHHFSVKLLDNAKVIIVPVASEFAKLNSHGSRPERKYQIVVLGSGMVDAFTVLLHVLIFT